jgi:hypothetical protein
MKLNLSESIHVTNKPQCEIGTRDLFESEVIKIMSPRLTRYRSVVRMFNAYKSFTAATFEKPSWVSNKIDESAVRYAQVIRPEQSNM